MAEIYDPEMSTARDYFVMLNHPNKNIQAMPMVDENENIAWFESEESARETAYGTQLGHAYGFEIFQLGHGE